MVDGRFASVFRESPLRRGELIGLLSSGRSGGSSSSSSPSKLSVGLSPYGLLKSGVAPAVTNVPVAYRIDGQLLNRRRKRFQPRVSAVIAHEVLLADDCVLNATSEGDMRRSIVLFSAACQNFGLIIKMEKAVVMHRQLPNAEYTVPRNQVDGTELKIVDNFKYPGSTMSCDIRNDNTVAYQISEPT
ncbi:hypothetical protein SprV_0501930000 [Sparganum proliferum]